MRWTVPAGLRLFTLWVTLALVGFLGVTYVTFYLAQTRYFTARNFRILTAIGEQVDQAVGAQSRVFRSLLTKRADAATAPKDVTGAPPAGRAPAWFRQARRNAPALQFVADPRQLPEARLPATAAVTTRTQMRSHGGELLLELAYTYADAGQPEAPVTDRVDLRLGAVLQTILGQRRYLDAFETLVVASPDGQVRHTTSAAREVLRLNRLDALTDSVDGGPGGARFRVLAQSSNVVDVVANGTAYRLFLQPCCRSLGSGATPGHDEGLVIAGLVATSRLNASSMTVSFTLVVVFGAVLLLGLLSWPFLKLLMMGETQRVTATHVLLVGTCSVAGMALLSLFLLNWYAYARFNREVDAQLRGLARDLAAAFASDIAAAYSQLECLTSRVKPSSPAAVSDSAIDGACRSASPETMYETFSLIGSDGMQFYKVGTDAWVPAQISVAERTYYREVRDGNVWPYRDPIAGGALRPGIYIESIQTWTSGTLRAIVAAPTTRDDLPVAAVSIPLRSLVEPLLVSGFQFAVVDQTGVVVFHADAQRNGRENLFAETDVNRRLRAAVAARQARPLTIRYWGRDHRAYVRPLAAGMPFALVTLYDKQAGWELQQEWLVASIGFVLLYLAVWLTLVAALFMNPQRRATWLWPHPAREAHYRALTVLYVALLAITGLAVWTTQGSAIVAVGTTTALVGGVLTFLLLRSAARVTSGAGGSIASYVHAAVLCLVLTAIAPALVYFVTAHHLHAESYVKYRQLKLADAIEARARRALARRPEGRPTVAGDAGTYASFFFGTSVWPRGSAGAAGRCRLESDARENRLDLIPSALEDWFPYQSETSAEMRELLGDGLATDHWHWRHGRRPADHAPCLTLTHGERQISSATPHLLPSGEEDRPGVAGAQSADGSGVSGAWWHLVAIGCALYAVAHLLVRFVCAKVFLIGLEPGPSGRDAQVGASGDHEFIWFSGDELPPAATGCCRLNLADLHRAAQGDAAGDLWFEALASMDHPECQAVVLDHFDVDVRNTALTEIKLDLLEELLVRQNRVVALTSRTSPRLVAGLSPALRERWATLSRELVVRDQRARSARGGERPADDPGWSWRRALPLLADLVGGRRLAGTPTLEGRSARTSADALREYRRARALAALRGEDDDDAVAAALCDELRARVRETDDPQTPAQLREEIDHRIAAHYRGLWATCTMQEKLVMSHIAQDGLVNPKSRRLVQRLVLRKLVRTCPDLRLMNRSFHRFALGDAQRVEVTHLEHADAGSAWDSFRYPFVAAMLGGGIFLVVTQKELFDATIASLGAVATTVPAVVRAIGLSRERTAWAQNGSRAADERRHT